MEKNIEKLSKFEFEKGTDIGFQMDEIKRTTTEDLMVLRSSIIAYLKSKKLKKRNSNYMDVFLRINKELQLRKKTPKFIITSDIVKESIPKKTDNSTTENKFFLELGITDPHIMNNHEKSLKNDIKIFDLFDFEKNKILEKKLINKKLYEKPSLEIAIPSFLNDKNSLKIQIIKESLQENQHLIKLNNLNLLSTNFSEFGKGLFNEKLDLELSEDDEPYHIDGKNTRKNTDVSFLEKEINITNAILGTIPEDMFFSLD